MPKPVSITYEEVEAACLAVLADGDNITFPKVYARLGRRGGGTTVNNLIAEWRQRCRQLFAHPELRLEGLPDPRLVEVVREGVVAAHRIAKEIVAEGYAQKEAALAKAHAEADRRVADAKASASATQALALQIEGNLAAANAELASKNAHLGTLQHTLDDERSQRSALDTRLAILSDRLNSERREHEAAFQRQVEETTVRIRELEHALADERTRMGEERKFLMQQTDILRQDKEHEIKELRRHLQAAQDEAKRALADRDAENVALRADLAAIRKNLSVALEAVQGGQDERLRLREQIDTLSTQLLVAHRAVADAEQAAIGAQAAREATARFCQTESERANRAEEDCRRLRKGKTESGTGKGR